eukprot:TRINITY_DN220_c0_g1_i1.p1 TRINITY_DN220_c0_g1~~TRINITY_DN220_c0_g1_i1.p1  ORF type:complete len:248 (+),score=63.86 TRINITY_DN220_c0_g1_i1:203-946(+)
MGKKEINWRNKLLIALQGQSLFDFELWYPSGIIIEDIKAMIELSNAKKGEEIFKNLQDIDEFTLNSLKESDLRELGFDLKSRKLFMHYQKIFKQSKLFENLSQKKCKKLYERITNSINLEEIENPKIEEKVNQKEKDKKEMTSPNKNEKENDEKELKTPSKKVKSPNKEENTPHNKKGPSYEIIMEMLLGMQIQIENIEKMMCLMNFKLDTKFILRGGLNFDNTSPNLESFFQHPNDKSSHFLHITN